jgi:hypothetical protein
MSSSPHDSRQPKLHLREFFSLVRQLLKWEIHS